MRRHAGAGAGAARGRVRRSDVRIGAVIDVEKRSLRAFEQNFFSLLQRSVQIDDGVGDERPQLFARPRDKSSFTFAKEIGLAPSAFRMLLFSRILACEFFREQLGLHQVGHAQTGARGLVAVGRTDAALGRADLGVAFAQLALFVERAVIGQNEMRAIADEQILADLDPELCAGLRFPRRARPDRSRRRCRSRRSCRGAECRTESDAGCISCRR